LATPRPPNEYFDTTTSNWDGNDAFEDQDWWLYLTSFTDKQTGSCGAVAYQTGVRQYA
jgi:hypothetical protein